MLIGQLVHFNADLVLVGIAITGIALLGFLVYFNNPNSYTNRSFLVFSIVTIIWSVSNYFEYRFDTIYATLWALRIHLFISTWHAFIFFTFCYIFPEEKPKIPSWYVFGLIPVVTITSFLTLTPLVFSSIDALAPQGQVTNPNRGPGLGVFSLVAFGLLFSGLYVLFRKWRISTSNARRQNELVFFGMCLTALLILGFNVFLPVVLNTLTFIPLAALFILPIVTSIAYAIMRYRLFNAKVVTAQIFSFLLCLATLVQVFFSGSLYELIFRAAAFSFVLVIAVLFVRSVFKEVSLRETIERQEKELEIVNAKQENLLHFISHEIKGYLTKGQNAFATIVEGDYGAVPDKVKELSQGALGEMRKGVSTVMEILDASNLKKGSMTFKKESLDLKPCVLEQVEDVKWSALRKGLQIETKIPDDSDFVVIGDKEKLTRHVLRNLIDNSIRYTPTGKVTVSLEKRGSKVLFQVSDTGVGITPEDMSRLFTEGGHGKDSIKVNVDSTGYGLFVAKQVVDAHEGKIYATSDGAGKGSTFSVELSAA